MQFIIPFLLTDLRQIPKNLLDKYNLKLEGTLFDASFLEDQEVWDLIEDNLLKVNKTYPKKLYSLHFPTDNANYLKDPTCKKNLFRFLDLAVEHKVQVVVLHSNFIQPITEFDVSLLKDIRKEFVSFFSEIDKYLKGKNILVAIENLPIIGNLGDDFDSVFVFPKDFQDVNFKNVKVVWDLCHWAFTYYSLNLLKHYSKHVSVTHPDLLAFKILGNKIVHIHFGSFTGLAHPNTNNFSEGSTPEEGDFPEELMIKMIKAVQEINSSVGITFEIKEDDYTKRENLVKALEWFKRTI